VIIIEHRWFFSNAFGVEPKTNTLPQHIKAKKRIPIVRFPDNERQKYQMKSFNKEDKMAFQLAGLDR